MLLPVLDVASFLATDLEPETFCNFKSEKHVVDFIEKCCCKNTGSEDLTKVVIEHIESMPTEELQDLVTRLQHMLENTRDPLGKDAYAITTLLVSCISVASTTSSCN